MKERPRNRNSVSKVEAVVQVPSIPVQASPWNHIYVNEEETMHCRDCGVLLT